MTFRLTGRLCKAARALSGLNQEQLARAAGVSKQTIVNFERGIRHPIRNNLEAIRSALENADVVFLDGGEGPGLRFREPRAPGPRDDAAPRAPGAGGEPPAPERSPRERG